MIHFAKLVHSYSVVVIHKEELQNYKNSPVLMDLTWFGLVWNSRIRNSGFITIGLTNCQRRVVEGHPNVGQVCKLKMNYFKTELYNERSLPHLVAGNFHFTLLSIIIHKVCDQCFQHYVICSHLVTRHNSHFTPSNSVTESEQHSLPANNSRPNSQSFV